MQKKYCQSIFLEHIFLKITGCAKFGGVPSCWNYIFSFDKFWSFSFWQFSEWANKYSLNNQDMLAPWETRTTIQSSTISAHTFTFWKYSLYPTVLQWRLSLINNLQYCHRTEEFDEWSVECDYISLALFQKLNSAIWIILLDFLNILNSLLGLHHLQ